MVNTFLSSCFFFGGGIQDSPHQSLQMVLQEAVVVHHQVGEVGVGGQLQGVEEELGGQCQGEEVEVGGQLQSQKEVEEEGVVVVVQDLLVEMEVVEVERQSALSHLEEEAVAVAKGC